MIIKNLSRKNASGGSGQLIKYIFRYIFKEQEITDAKPNVYDRQIYIPRGVRFNKKDIAYIKAEIEDGRILADLKAKYPEYNYTEYIQKYLLPKQVDKQNEPSVQFGQSNGEPFIIKHNMRARSLNGFIREMEQNEKGRIHKRSDQTGIHHTIISWSNKDKELVTEAKLRDMAKEYIRLRGENNIYVGSVHLDRQHTHLHIAMSATQLDGKSSRISKKEFEDVKVKLQEYQKQKYPELSHSLPEHGRSKKQEKTKYEKHDIKRNERAVDKNLIHECLETAYPQASSTQHFLSLLKEHGYSAYYRAGRLTGIQSEQGLKFRFSRLGVDMDRLKELDGKAFKEQQTLQELKQIRQRDMRELGRSIDNTEQDKELTAIESLRNSARPSRGKASNRFDMDPVSKADTVEQKNPIKEQVTLQELQDIRSGIDRGAERDVEQRNERIVSPQNDVEGDENPNEEEKSNSAETYDTDEDSEN